MCECCANCANLMNDLRTPREWEVHCGKGKEKKWTKSISVLDGNWPAEQSGGTMYVHTPRNAPRTMEVVVPTWALKSGEYSLQKETPIFAEYPGVGSVKVVPINGPALMNNSRRLCIFVMDQNREGGATTIRELQQLVAKEVAPDGMHSVSPAAEETLKDLDDEFFKEDWENVYDIGSSAPVKVRRKEEVKKVRAALIPQPYYPTEVKERKKEDEPPTKVRKKKEDELPTKVRKKKEDELPACMEFGLYATKRVMEGEPVTEAYTHGARVCVKDVDVPARELDTNYFNRQPLLLKNLMVIGNPLITDACMINQPKNKVSNTKTQTYLLKLKKDSIPVVLMQIVASKIIEFGDEVVGGTKEVVGGTKVVVVEQPKEPQKWWLDDLRRIANMAFPPVSSSSDHMEEGNEEDEEESGDAIDEEEDGEYVSGVVGEMEGGSADAGTSISGVMEGDEEDDGGKGAANAGGALRKRYREEEGEEDASGAEAAETPHKCKQSKKAVRRGSRGSCRIAEREAAETLTKLSATPPEMLVLAAAEGEAAEGEAAEGEAEEGEAAAVAEGEAAEGEAAVAEGEAAEGEAAEGEAAEGETAEGEAAEGEAAEGEAAEGEAVADVAPDWMVSAAQLEAQLEALTNAAAEGVRTYSLAQMELAVKIEASAVAAAAAEEAICLAEDAEAAEAEAARVVETARVGATESTEALLAALRPGGGLIQAPPSPACGAGHP